MANRNPVAATLVDDVTAVETPGAYQIDVEDDAIAFNCPCGCGHTPRIRIYSGGAEKSGTPSWSWNGDRQKPTLRPSIRDVGSCYFHGYLTDGQWTFCSDSGVKPQRVKG